ncbi:MAG: undecaprenyl-diphosphatase UppP [Acidobacteriota bacterium]|nr:undecaprenyl-diphosphatase UppP [Acidobacteriota bacterium]
MPIYQAVVLAIVQGIAEFLPISSTGHLILFPWFLGWKDPGLTFDVALHAGTLLAVLVYFWRMWVDMIKAAAGLGDASNPRVKENRKLFWLLVIATIPGGIAGVLFEKKADTAFRNPVVIGVALIVVALVMWAGEKITQDSESLTQVPLLDAVIVGIAQAFAVIPGVSRSGSTMAAGLLRNMKRETAARFSFLLSTPIIAGAVLLKAAQVHHAGGLPASMRAPFLAGVIVSAVVGFFVIGWLIRFLESRTFKPFIIYRIALGVLVLALGLGLHR